MTLFLRIKSEELAAAHHLAIRSRIYGVFHTRLDNESKFQIYLMFYHI